MSGSAHAPTDKSAGGNQLPAEGPESQIPDKLVLSRQPGKNAPAGKSEVGQNGGESHKVRWWRWLLGIMDRHNGALNAIFSGFVAFFTLMLFLVGRDQHNTLKVSVSEAKRAGDAATSTAQAVINVELAVLVWTKAVLRRQGIPGPGGVVQPDSVRQSLRTPRFDVTIKNYGRTPAFVSALGADTFVGVLPEIPTWIEYLDLDSSVVIEPKDAYGFETIGRRAALSEADIDAVMAGSPLWVCWFLVYRDFLGRRNIYRDARRLYVLNADGDHTFIDEAPDAYRWSGLIIEGGEKG